MFDELSDPRERMRHVVQDLEGEYGVPTNARELDPLDTLIETVLSQQNSTESTRRVFAELKRRYPTWSAVCEAPVEAIADAISAGGLARIKAARIKAILGAIEAERGALDLDFLTSMRPEEALAYLTRFPGVGPKTARCTLLFSCAMDLFPMDVHIFRILLRLGLLAPGASDERAHQLVAELIPSGKHYSAHVNLIRHGRRICRPSRPRCDRCCLVSACPSGQARLVEVETDDPRSRG